MSAPMHPALSHRALLSWFIAAGATTLLAACSGATSNITSAPVTAESAITASTTAGAATSAQTLVTGTSGTTHAAGGTSGATAAIRTAGITPHPGALLAALATVPQDQFLPGLAGVAYADFATLKG